MKKEQTQSHTLKWGLLSVLSVTILLFIALFLMPRPTYQNGFTTLEDLVVYTKTHNEYIPMDTDNTIKPDFTTYYKTLQSHWKKDIYEKILKILTILKLKNEPIWSASYFKYQLFTLTKSRQEKQLAGNFVCKVTPSLNSKIIVFGNIQGALHSLTRCLTKLKDLDLIDRNFKIKKADTVIIFMGDIINRSPYSMETLSVVMKLLETNPGNVVYLRGNHETNNYWQEHTFKIELQIRAAHLGKGTIPLADEANAFFDTLPLAAYINLISNNHSEFLRISDPGRDQNETLNEENYSKFLHTNAKTLLSYHNLKEKEANGNPVEIKVIIKGEKKREKYQPHNGLRFLPSDMGSTAWTILSCPTLVYQKAIKFMHDAFIIISPAQKIDDWKITLYNRNVTTQEPFQSTSFYLISGADEKEVGEKRPPKEDEKKSSIKEEMQAPLQDVKKTEKVTQEKNIVEQKLDLKTTESIIHRAEEISKFAKALSQEAEKIAAELKAVEKEGESNPLKEKPETISSTPTISVNTKTENVQTTAFEPIEPNEKNKE